MKISVIIVVFNAGDSLKVTLESVVNQELNNYEIIVIDGDSNDKRTIEIHNEYEKFYDYFSKEKDDGIYDAMNKGMRVATGEFLFFLNAGDTLVDEKVFSIVNEFLDSYDIVYGDIELYSAEQEFIKNQAAKALNKKNLLFWGTRTVCHQAIFVKKEISEGYNLEYRYKAELDWYFNIIKNTNKIKKINILISRYYLGGFGYENFKRNQAERFKCSFEHGGGIGFILNLINYFIGMFFYCRSKYVD